MTNCSLSSLDLGSLPERETSIASNFYVKIPPTMSLPAEWDQELRLIFDLGNSPQWIDAMQMSLQLLVQLRDKKGEVLTMVKTIFKKRVLYIV